MVDKYTKAVLTVIAACLVVIAFRDAGLTGKASAQNGPVHVILDSVNQFAYQFVTLKVSQH
jgi:hypothetical protein